MKHFKTLLFFLISFSFSLALFNCNSVEYTTTTSDDDPGDKDEYVEEEGIKEEHAVGDSSCPQNLAVLSVFPSGKKTTLSMIDSCDAFCSNSSIDVFFNGDKNAEGFNFNGSSDACSMNIEFNCNEAVDVNASVECTFYQDNKEVASASIPVQVDVK